MVIQAAHGTISGGIISNVKQDGITLSPNPTAVTDVNIDGVTMVGAADSISKLGSYAIDIINSSRIKISNIHAYNFRHGILIFNSTTTDMTGIDIEENTLTNIGDANTPGTYRGIYFTKSSSGVIRDSLIANNLISDGRTP